MNTQWQDFLTAAGARIQNGSVTNFGNPAQECTAVEHGNVLADLSQEGLICVTGVDAAKFLQGQLTCHLNEVTPETSRLGAWCTSKGRVRITFRLFRWQDGFYLALPAVCVDDTMRQLQKYILRAKVALHNASAERIRLGCCGPAVIEPLRTLFPRLPEQPDQVVQEGTTTIMRLRGGADAAPCFELLSDIHMAMNVWNRVRTCATAVGAAAWSAISVRAGVPVITPELAEAFVPHMLNLPELGAVHFQKGCYSGQEIVARTQYLGKSKRRLYLAWVAGEEPPQVGTVLWAPVEDEQNPGQVVNVAPAPEGGFLLLAVLPVADVRGGTVRLRDSTGPALVFRALPYPVAAAE